MRNTKTSKESLGRDMFSLVLYARESIADSASNAQTAGAIMHAHFPWITTVHGSEHGTSLVFSRITKKQR